MRSLLDTRIPNIHSPITKSYAIRTFAYQAPLVWNKPLLNWGTNVSPQHSNLHLKHTFSKRVNQILPIHCTLCNMGSVIFLLLNMLFRFYCLLFLSTISDRTCISFNVMYITKSWWTMIWNASANFENDFHQKLIAARNHCHWPKHASVTTTEF